MSSNLYLLFRRRFAAFPDAVFLDVPGEAPVTFAETDRRCGQISRRLRALGLRPGDRVTVQVEKSVAAVMLYLACLRSGTVYSPLNTAYTDSELAYFLGDATPGLLVCDPAREVSLTAIAHEARVAHIRSLDRSGHGSLVEGLSDTGDEPVCPRAGSDLAAILYTSGTTGRSKGAMITHDNLASNALSLHRIWGWRPGDVLIHALPIFHVHGLFVALHCALLNASRTIFLPRFDADQVIDHFAGATVMMGVPTFYTRLLDNPRLDRGACAGMRLFISGSAPLLDETFHAFETRTGHRILERYGMTEAGMITSNPLDGERIPGTVGFPLPDVRVRVADDEGRILGAGETGVLEIHGPNVFAGYWQSPEKTTQEFRPDGWFITGDVARLDDDGRVAIVGRARDLIISGGYNVYPREVENCINAIDGVRDSAVFGVPHGDFGEAVMAAVCWSGDDRPAEEFLISRLASQLARFKQPKRIVFLDELPRNAMGKVQKNVLRERYAGLFR